MTNILHETCVCSIHSVMQTEENCPAGELFITKMKRSFSAFEHDTQKHCCPTNLATCQTILWIYVPFRVSIN